MVVGGWWLGRIVKKAVRDGETFALPFGSKGDETAASLAAEELESHNSKKTKGIPNIIFAILPLIIVIGLLNILANFMSPTAALLLALATGIFLACVLMFKYIKEFWESFAVGTQNALIALANTCAVVGFGSVAAQSAAFDSLINSLVNIPGPPLLGLAVGVTLICGITGSASGGLGIALPILAPIYMAQGLDPGAMHRISSLASGGMDSLPHNGYVVTTVRVIC